MMLLVAFTCFAFCLVFPYKTVCRPLWFYPYCSEHCWFAVCCFCPSLVWGLLLFSHSVLSNSLSPQDCSTPGFPVLHYLPGFAQTHVHWVNDAIQPSRSLWPPSPHALNVSHHHHYHLIKRAPIQAAHLPNRGASWNSHHKQGQGLKIKKNPALRKQIPPRPCLWYRAFYI